MRTEFLNAMQAIPDKEPAWQKFSEVIPSTARIENYAWMTPAPGISRYQGHRRFAQLDQIKYTVENVEFDGSISVANRDVEDDQIGGYKKRFQDLGQKARIFPGIQIQKGIVGGKTTPCFDGTNFFASAHTFGTGSAAPTGFGGGLNFLTFTSSNTSDAIVHRFCIVLNNGSLGLKPFLWQNRKGPELDTDAGTPANRKAKRTDYWVDLEGANGYGYWWDALLVEITNTPSLLDIFTCIDAAIKQFYTFQLPIALPTDPVLYVHTDLEFEPNVATIICSTGLYPLLRHALKEDRVGVSVAGSTAGITSNIYYNLFGLMASGYMN
jgi:phage major head subunit gpT-like protein